MDSGLKKIIDKDVIQISRISIVEQIIDRLNQYNDTVLVCILKGAAYFAVDLSRDLDRNGFKHSVYFVEASSYSGMEQKDSVELLSRLVPEKLDGKHILLVDELYDNGKTMHNIREYLNSNIKHDGITTCVMFKKRCKTQKYTLPDIFGLEVPNVWIVGYGLDDDGYYRGLEDLYAKPKTRGIDWTSDDWKIFINKK